MNISLLVILTVIPPRVTGANGNNQLDDPPDLTSENATLRDGLDGPGSTSNPRRAGLAVPRSRSDEIRYGCSLIERLPTPAGMTLRVASGAVSRRG